MEVLKSRVQSEVCIWNTNNWIIFVSASRKYKLLSLYVCRDEAGLHELKSSSVHKMKSFVLAATVLVFSSQACHCWRSSSWLNSVHSQVSCDWSGSGRIQCYGQVDTDVSTPPGGDYIDNGRVTCRPKEWDGSNGVGPEAMFFTPDSGAEFEIWAVSSLCLQRMELFFLSLEATAIVFVILNVSF